MKVVLDTNILISALLFKGRLEPIFNLIEDNEITLCFIPSTFQEFKEVIGRKKFQPRLDELRLGADEIVEAVLAQSRLLPEPGKKISAIKDDPSDDKFLDSAIACRASFIISGDKHLLRLRGFQGIPIITPREFLRKRRER